MRLSSSPPRGPCSSDPELAGGGRSAAALDVAVAAASRSTPMASLRGRQTGCPSGMRAVEARRGSPCRRSSRGPARSPLLGGRVLAGGDEEHARRRRTGCASRSAASWARAAPGRRCPRRSLSAEPSSESRPRAAAVTEVPPPAAWSRSSRSCGRSAKSGPSATSSSPPWPRAKTSGTPSTGSEIAPSAADHAEPSGPLGDEDSRRRAGRRCPRDARARPRRVSTRARCSEFIAGARVCSGKAGSKSGTFFGPCLPIGGWARDCAQAGARRQ